MGQFEPIWVLGCMSGTSMDGVDCAAILTDGIEVFDFGGSASIEFTACDRKVIAAALGMWPGDDAGILAKAAEVVLLRHVHAITSYTGKIDLIGFHGQTVNHDPEHGRTFQLGDGAALARATGVRTVWDFRTADMEAGGEGAPLVPFFHFACAKKIGAKEPIAFLNLGGIGNVTWVNPEAAEPIDHGALLAFDTGPGSALIDDFVKARLGLNYDKDGALAARGVADTAVVERFLEHPYFSTMPPKSLDRNSFDSLLDRVATMPDADAAATLTAATVASVVSSAAQLPTTPSRWLICGGGRLNKTIMAGLRAGLGVKVDMIEAVGLDGGLLEAEAFAYLAVRRLRGLPASAPETTGCRHPVSGGRISDP